MWTKILENPKAIEMFDPEPSLQCVVLSRLTLDRDGPTATMSIQTNEYPSNPPAKWKLQYNNAVTIELQAMGVDHLKLEGWSTENQVSVSIERLSDGKIKIRVVGVVADVELQCGWLRILRITPHFRSV